MILSWKFPINFRSKAFIVISLVFLSIISNSWNFIITSCALPYFYAFAIFLAVIGSVYLDILGTNRLCVSKLILNSLLFLDNLPKILSGCWFWVCCTVLFSCCKAIFVFPGEFLANFFGLSHWFLLHIAYTVMLTISFISGPFPKATILSTCTGFSVPGHLFSSGSYFILLTVQIRVQRSMLLTPSVQKSFSVDSITNS